MIKANKLKLFVFYLWHFEKSENFDFFLWKKENYLYANLRVSASGLPQIQIFFQQMLKTQIDLFQSFLSFCWFLYIEQWIKYSAIAAKNLYLLSACLWVATTCRVYFIKSKLKGSLDLLNLIRLNFKLFCVTLSGSVRRITLGCLCCLSVEEYCEKKWKRNIFLSPSKRFCVSCVCVWLKIQLVDQFVRFSF